MATLCQDALSDPDCGTLPKPNWMLRFADRPKDVTKIWSILQLNDSCHLRISLGTKVAGHFVTGDKDGPWGNLREARICIDGAVDSFKGYICRDIRQDSADPGHLDSTTWLYALEWMLQAACHSAMGEHAPGKLLEVHEAIEAVVLACKELNRGGKASPIHDLESNVVDAYYQFMTVTCALWQDLWHHVMSKTAAGHTASMALVVPRVRLSAKMRAARCLVESLPSKLTKGAGVKLAELREDTLEIYDLAMELLTRGKEADVPLEQSREYKAFALFYEAAKRLAGTSLAQLKEEGLTTVVTDEEWAVAAAEGLVIYMRGEAAYLTLPPDLLERMLDYVIHVVAILALLFSSPGERHKVDIPIR